MIPVELVTVYPGAQTLTLAEAVTKVASMPNALVLGAMRPGYLGREMVTVDELREATSRRYRGLCIVRASHAPEWLGPQAAPGWVAYCPCGDRVWGSYQSDVKRSIGERHQECASTS